MFEQCIVKGTKLVMDFPDDEPEVDSQLDSAEGNERGLNFAETLLQKVCRAFSSEQDSNSLADCLLETVTLFDMLDLDRQALTSASSRYRFDTPAHKTITFSALQDGVRIHKVSEWDECHCIDRSLKTRLRAESLLKSDLTLDFLPAKAGSRHGPLLTVALGGWSYIGDTEITRRLATAGDGRTPGGCMVRLLADLCARGGLRLDIRGAGTQQKGCLPLACQGTYA
ncbi:hypothetical protein LMG32289_06150 [Cupriavidus pampae]|uniref:Uncharacterized protein n=2 Tax=Cupriavidus pampae TaxID=659251 RepID=A0ABN7ZK60_9BURK|nr:hypothetical protein LMG32289_06150 [Cupriavidus pampae]